MRGSYWVLLLSILVSTICAKGETNTNDGMFLFTGFISVYTLYNSTKIMRNFAFHG
jgi:hypothetical protein